MSANTSTTYPDIDLLIDGQWRTGSEGQRLAVRNPASGEVIGQVACATLADLDAAAQAAQRGFLAWRVMPAMQRRQQMRDAAALLRQRIDQIAPWLTMEQGKPLREAKAEIAMAADIVDWFADEAPRITGRLLPARAADTEIQVLKQPVGPVAAFTPWNFPVNQLVRKVATALATGCSVVAKAPEETPAGVVNLVYGDPAQISQALIAHPAIRKISFTGSTPVGKLLAAQAGTHMKRTTMELGGHAPVIIAPCADPEAAARAFAATKFRNAGQICVSPTRFLVHASLRDRFVEALVAVAKQQRVGNGLDPETTMGPLANARRVAAMRRLTADARERGATLAVGDADVDDGGCYFPPTVLIDAPTDSLLWNEEPFGPVAGVRSYERIDEAVAEANRLPYGLAAYLAARDASTIHHVSRELECGMVWVNEAAPAWPELPFGGTKDSGIGSEGGVEALEAYLQTKMVSVRHLAR